MMTTACYSGFHALYELTDKELILREFTLNERSKNYLPIAGKKPEITENLGSYSDLNLKVDFTGCIGERIKELEGCYNEFKTQYEAIKEKNDMFSMTPVDRKMIVDIVGDFLKDFEKNFDRVSPVERKELIRQVIEKILVDRESGEVKCFIKCFPGVENDRVLNENGTDFWVKGLALMRTCGSQ